MAKEMKPGDNDYDPDELLAFAKAHQAEDEKVASIMGAAKAECKKPRKAQKNILRDVKKAGIPLVAFRENLEIRKLERKIEERREFMDPEDQESLDKIRHSLRGLEGTPLGQAALDKLDA